MPRGDGARSLDGAASAGRDTTSRDVTESAGNSGAACNRAGRTQPQPVFLNRENSFLFATSAAFSAADFVVTRDNLRGGGQELDPVTRVFGRSTPGLAVNFAAETAGVVGISYMFHKTGHHKLERYVSMLNIGSSAAAVSFDLAHR